MLPRNPRNPPDPRNPPRKRSRGASSADDARVPKHQSTYAHYATSIDKVESIVRAFASVVRFTINTTQPKRLGEIGVRFQGQRPGIMDLQVLRGGRKVYEPDVVEEFVTLSSDKNDRDKFHLTVRGYAEKLDTEEGVRFLELRGVTSVVDRTWKFSLNERDYPRSSQEHPNPKSRKMKIVEAAMFLQDYAPSCLTLMSLEGLMYSMIVPWDDSIPTQQALVALDNYYIDNDDEPVLDVHSVITPITPH